jgi:hypothetical protein
MQETIFWDLALCILVRTDVSEERIASIFRAGEDGGDTFLRNVGFNQKYTVQNPRKRFTEIFLIFLFLKVTFHNDKIVK